MTYKLLLKIVNKLSLKNYSSGIEMSNVDTTLKVIKDIVEGNNLEFLSYTIGSALLLSYRLCSEKNTFVYDNIVRVA